ncbi:hypothetical protein CS022_03605 [Veronia nyctiphanis]|uniref:Uncharacterized protein n=1 Tax=Veronia nyctiphanis TaxID=1278244 RepID=A0A4Q0YZP6_9GAMM|nr:HAD-IIB family hydrolase [Veronia nyctiphanis]RXJ74649.1 hypothetical protein CS022_03605 [Veronia nyctiphanis]
MNDISDISNTLFVTDLDGTLLNEHQTLSDAALSFFLEHDANHLNFTYATARSLTSSRFVLDSLNLKLPVILYNGAQIYCPVKQEYIHSAYLEQDVASSLIGQFIEDGMSPVVHCIDENGDLRVYFQNISNPSTAKWLNSRLERGDTRFRATTGFSEITQSHVIEIMLADCHERLSAYQPMLDNDNMLSYVLSEDIYSPGHFWLEVSNAKANKGDAVAALKTHLNLSHIVTFGDNHNDIPMFQRSDWSFAVENGVESAHAAASHVIGKNTEDTVITQLRAILQNSKTKQPA